MSPMEPFDSEDEAPLVKKIRQMGELQMQQLREKAAREEALFERRRKKWIWRTWWAIKYWFSDLIRKLFRAGRKLNPAPASIGEGSSVRMGDNAQMEGKFTPKEVILAVFAAAPTLASLLIDDPWVFGLMLLVSLVAALWVCRIHQARPINRIIAAILATAVIGFIGARGYVHFKNKLQIADSIELQRNANPTPVDLSKVVDPEIRTRIVQLYDEHRKTQAALHAKLFRAENPLVTANYPTSELEIAGLRPDTPAELRQAIDDDNRTYIESMKALGQLVETPVPAQSSPLPKKPKPAPTLHGLFLDDLNEKGDGGNLPGTIEVEYAPSKSIQVEFKALISTVANSEFLIFYVRPTLDTYEVCDAIADWQQKARSQIGLSQNFKGSTFRSFADDAEQSMGNLVFTNVVYIYCEIDLSLEKRAALQKKFESKGLLLHLRSSRYLSDVAKAQRGEQNAP